MPFAERLSFSQLVEATLYFRHRLDFGGGGGGGGGRLLGYVKKVNSFTVLLRNFGYSPMLLDGCLITTPAINDNLNLGMVCVLARLVIDLLKGDAWK